jgi:hypothetical protein
LWLPWCLLAPEAGFEPPVQSLAAEALAAGSGHFESLSSAHVGRWRRLLAGSKAKVLSFCC